MSDPRAAAFLAQAFRDLQAGEAARALDNARRAAEADPASAPARLAAGLAHEALGAPDAALAEYRRAIALQPNFTPAHFAIGMQHFARAQWREASDAFAAVVRAEPSNAEALVNLGQALAQAGGHAAAEEALRRAVQLRPQFAPAHHALGWVLRARGRTRDGAASLRAALAIDPRDPNWHVDLANALVDLRHVDEAHAVATQALRAHPEHPALLRLMGQTEFLRGELARAAEMLTAAAGQIPSDTALPMLLAQVELLLGRWQSAWVHYSWREQRRRFASERAMRGLNYEVPQLATIAGRRVTLVAEQGLGDVLFFLRFARELQMAGAELDFAGDARLLPLLERTRLFRRLRASATLDESRAELPILVGDLPLVSASPDAPFPPSLEIVPDAARVREWSRRLEAAGPRPWIGVTWRAGTPADVLAHGLYKTIPLADFFTALRPLGGTVVALQRGILAGELDTARSALGNPVHDFSHANDDLEDALALVSVLDRHVAVSNTNMHLAAAAGATGDVLVPYPPEWRWRMSGDSPWFPGFRVHRRSRDFDWSSALAALTP